MTRRQIVILLIALLMPLPANAEDVNQDLLGASQRAKTSIYVNEVPFGGIALVQVDDTCLAIISKMSAGEFFKGLRRITTRNAPEFYKGSKRVEYFPEELVIKILAGTIRCPQSSRGSMSRIHASSVEEMFESLQYEMEWARGLSSRPAKYDLSGKPQKSYRESVTGTEIDTYWTQELAVRARKVPLTDHLRISLILEDGMLIARFSARLD